MVDIGMSLSSVRISIMERILLECLGPVGVLQGMEVFRGQITDAERVPTDDDGDIKPYACVVFGTPAKATSNVRGITGVRDDLRRFTFGVELYATGDSELDTMQDRMIHTLVGFEPVGAGEIDVITSGEIANPAQIKQNHTRIGRGLIFECYANTITPNTIG